MRNLIVCFFVVLSFVFIQTCGNSDATNQTQVFRYVIAKSGLRMRNQPNATATRITTIPNESMVQLLEEKSRTITLAGKSGKWSRVQWKNHEGWVFGGFLSTSKPASRKAPKPENSGPYSRDAYSRNAYGR